MIIDMQRIFGEPVSEWATPDYASAAAGIRRLLPHSSPYLRHTVPAARDSRPVSGSPTTSSGPLLSTPRTRRCTSSAMSSHPLRRPLSTGRPSASGTPRPTERSDTLVEIVLAGVTTDCCVLSTALAAADAGVHVIVAADACAGVTETDHQRALDAMALYSPLIDIAEVDTILASGPDEHGRRPGPWPCMALQLATHSACRPS